MNERVLYYDTGIPRLLLTLFLHITLQKSIRNLNVLSQSLAIYLN